MGQAMMFVSLLVLTVLFTIPVVCFACRCFLVIVEGTASGNDEITWPDEPYLDWLGRAMSLLYLTAFWLVPVGFTMRALGNAFLPGDPLLRFFVLALPCLWLFLPVGVLSSMSTASPWVFFNPKLIPALFRCGGAMAGLYCLSAILLLATSAAVYLALSGAGYLLPVAALAVSTTLFIYARHLGRVACRISQLRPMRKARTEPRPPKKVLAKVEVVDPWNAAEEPERPRSKRQKAPAKRPISDELESYGLEDPTPPAPQVMPSVEQVLQEPVPEKRTREKMLSVVLRRPFVPGVLAFPWYPLCLPQWLALALGLFCLGVLLQTVRSLWMG